MDAKVNNKDSAFNWATRVLRGAVDSGSFGTITFSLQNGVIANARRETTLRPSDDVKPIIDRQGDKA